MEKNIAILMADLSGYTALTETHGPASAADLIDKYISIAEKCLVGDCKLHQCIGDEIMFISENPDHLLQTAVNLEASIVTEENFLQVHGGLHFGNILERGGNYFGSTVNLASRIAAKADAGSFWCSGEFENSISDKSICTFSSKGKHLFKNIVGEKEVFEIGTSNFQTYHIDPVCRMLIIDHTHAVRRTHEDERYFCSSKCLEIYEAQHLEFEAAQNECEILIG